MDDAPVLQALEHFGLRTDVVKGQARIVCPFHEDAAPSLDLDLRRGYFNCLGCNAHGDFIEFVGRLISQNGRADRMAALRLITRLKLQPAPDVPRLGYRRQYARMEPGDVFSAFRSFTAVNWEGAAPRDPATRYLLEKRGFTRETLAAFDVRLTDMPDYPIVIPLRQDKQMVGYVYRRIDNLEGADTPKYRYNSGLPASEVVIYYKKSVQPLLVVEGIMDLMKAAQYDYGHAAAILSWKIKPKQTAWLHGRGVQRVICALDNSPQGREGCAELVRRFKQVQRFPYPGTHRKDLADCSVYEFRRAIMTTLEEKQQGR